METYEWVAARAAGFAASEHVVADREADSSERQQCGRNPERQDDGALSEYSDLREVRWVRDRAIELPTKARHGEPFACLLVDVELPLP